MTTTNQQKSLLDIIKLQTNLLQVMSDKLTELIESKIEMQAMIDQQNKLLAEYKRSQQ